jgi:glycerophosphoryl diester phosphodiesterase
MFQQLGWLTICWLVALSASMAQPTDSLDIQGHRGCRGLLPENTIPAFLKAVELGVTTLELDVVISQDKQVVVSHEPFLSHVICKSPTGKAIEEEDEKKYNLYEMPYAVIEQCDCGSQPHPQFPEQENFPAYRPLLSEVIDTVEQFIAGNGYEPVFYNIETKSSEAGDDIFHPKPAEFTDLLLSVLNEKELQGRVVIQSFDVRTLQEIKQKKPELKLALLIGNTDSPKENLDKLGFTPTIYSPYYKLVDANLMKLARRQKMQIIPWTVNEPEDIENMLEMGVDGIISDYPNRVIDLVKE